MVREDFQDQLPETEEAIRLLPGVGPYSAGALLSIAFDQPFPLVDGNVQRVFSRLFALGGDLKHGLGHQKVWRIARHLLPVRRPGDFNQALMEWGATVCLPTNPLCPACPLASICLAKKLDRIDRYPSATVKTALKTVHMAAALFRDHDRILIQKRPETSRWWKGLWELPSAEGLDSVSALARLEEDLKVKLEPEPLVSTRHQVTHHKIDLRLYTCKETLKQPHSYAMAWIHPKTSHRYPLSSAHSKLILRWLERSKRPTG
jgi:A/G-specific adenine glycosylase